MRESCKSLLLGQLSFPPRVLVSIHTCTASPTCEPYCAHERFLDRACVRVAKRRVTSCVPGSAWHQVKSILNAARYVSGRSFIWRTPPRDLLWRFWNSLFHSSRTRIFSHVILSVVAWHSTVSQSALPHPLSSLSLCPVSRPVTIPISRVLLFFVMINCK